MLLLFNFIYLQCYIRQMGCHMFVVNIDIAVCVTCCIHFIADTLCCETLYLLCI